MTNPLGSTEHISFQVRDQEGTTSIVQLTVDASDASGTLSILGHAGAVSRQFELSHLKKDLDGTQLTCYVSGVTATLSLERVKNPPELHVVASVFWPLFEAAYQIDPAEQERLMAWINALKIDLQASS
jgi:hypothetical protein